MIIDAYCRIRTIDNTIPDEVLDFMKDCALKKLERQKSDSENFLLKDINQSAEIIYKNNAEKGFWDSQRNVGEMLMLITSELGEAMEAHRKGKFANWQLFDRELISNLPINSFEFSFQKHIKDTFEDEVADAIIRLLDMAGGLKIDLEKHINKKVLFNLTRPKHHGKNY